MRKNTKELGPSEEELLGSYNYEEEILIPQAKNLKTIFSLKLNDREIWVNEYFLSQPYVTSKNSALFEYIINNSGREIKKENLPAMLKTQLGGKTFTKILSELGFTGEILKVFFPKRGKSSLLFRNNVYYNTLAGEGFNMYNFIEELKKSNNKNNSK